MSSCETTALKRAVTRLMVLSTKREKRVLNSRQAWGSSAKSARTSAASSVVAASCSITKAGGWGVLRRLAAATVVDMGKGILAFEVPLQHTACRAITLALQVLTGA